MTSLKPLDAMSHIRQVCRYSVAGIWFYQGLVPKLLGPHADEVIMTKAFGIPENLQSAASYAAGAAEIGLALCILLLTGKVWPQWVSAVAMLVLLAFVAIYVPSYMLGAFNPVVMNVASFALSLIAILSMGKNSTE